MAPAGTPNAVVHKLHDALEQALKASDVRARLTNIGAEPEGGPPERVTQRMGVELTRWATIIKESGATAD